MSLRSSAGPATCRMPTPSSLRTICASDVLPSPGGPASSTWSSASPRALAASSAICELLLDALLADEVGERCAAGATARAPPRCRRAPARGTGSCSLPERLPHLLFDRQRVVDLGERTLGVEQRPAELDQGVPGSQGRRRLARRRVGEFLLQLQHDTLSSLAADTGDRLEPLHVVAGDRAAKLGRRRARRRSRARPSARRRSRRAAARTARARRPTRSRRAAARPRGRPCAPRP